jgi:hypothetical protein
MDPAACLLLARRRVLTRPGWAGPARLARQRLKGQERRDACANNPAGQSAPAHLVSVLLPAAALWVFEHHRFSIHGRDRQTPATSRCATADVAHASAGTTPAGSPATPRSRPPDAQACRRCGGRAAARACHRGRGHRRCRCSLRGDCWPWRWRRPQLNAARTAPPLLTKAVRAAPPLPQERQAPHLPAAPGRELPGGLHLHFHGAGSESAAARRCWQVGPVAVGGWCRSRGPAGRDRRRAGPGRRDHLPAATSPVLGHVSALKHSARRRPRVLPLVAGESAH